MTQEEIKQGNKLMAEFVGMQQGRLERWPDDWFDPNGVINGNRNRYLLFNDDWNWLMVAVRKAYDTDEYYTYVHKTSGQFDNGIELTTNKQEVYKQVVAFIKWYNENK